MVSSKQSDIYKRLFDKETVLDLLLHIEKFLDDSNLYVYPNWFDGELHSGPFPKRYWVEVSLRFPYEKMPCPNAAKILTSVGAKVKYKKVFEIRGVEVREPSDVDLATNKPLKEKVPIWVVELKIPRRLIDEADVENLEMFDDEIDVDDVSDATDAGEADE